jgi:hypothetical protein
MQQDRHRMGSVNVVEVKDATRRDTFDEWQRKYGDGKNDNRPVVWTCVCTNHSLGLHALCFVTESTQHCRRSSPQEPAEQLGWSGCREPRYHFSLLGPRSRSSTSSKAALWFLRRLVLCFANLNFYMTFKNRSLRYRASYATVCFPRSNGSLLNMGI